MRTARGLLVCWAVLAGSAGCAIQAEQPVAMPEATTPTAVTTAAAPTSPTPASRAEAIRDWEVRAGDHFKESATALERISEASDAEDEAGLLAGCRQLHDTNSLGLQDDLPTPDQSLTNELQRMIDDMNTATHACLRFALNRKPAEAETYQNYLGRAVEHLQRAKVMLNALRR
ncbi:MAG: hypothetical protein KIH64_004685 [Mycobacterium sp.]|nr:hypothetical protein [Mycobacterium sp.]